MAGKSSPGLLIEPCGGLARHAPATFIRPTSATRTADKCGGRRADKSGGGTEKTTWAIPSDLGLRGLGHNRHPLHAEERWQENRLKVVSVPRYYSPMQDKVCVPRIMKVDHLHRHARTSRAPPGAPKDSRAHHRIHHDPRFQRFLTVSARSPGPLWSATRKSYLVSTTA